MLLVLRKLLLDRRKRRMKKGSSRSVELKGRRDIRIQQLLSVLRDSLSTRSLIRSDLFTF